MVIENMPKNTLESQKLAKRDIPIFNIETWISDSLHIRFQAIISSVNQQKQQFCRDEEVQIFNKKTTCARKQNFHKSRNLTKCHKSYIQILPDSNQGLFLPDRSTCSYLHQTSSRSCYKKCYHHTHHVFVNDPELRLQTEGT